MTGKNNNAGHPPAPERVSADIPPGFVVTLMQSQNRPVTPAEMRAFVSWQDRCGVTK